MMMDDIGEDNIFMNSSATLAYDMATPCITTEDLVYAWANDYNNYGGAIVVRHVLGNG